MIATHDLPSLTTVLSRVVEPIGPHPLEQLARTTSEPIRPAAVLVPIVLRDGGAELLLTVRNANLKSHSGRSR